MGPSTNRRGFFQVLIGIPLLAQLAVSSHGSIVSRGVDVTTPRFGTVTIGNDAGISYTFPGVRFKYAERTISLWRGGFITDQELIAAMERATTSP